MTETELKAIAAAHTVPPIASTSTVASATICSRDSAARRAFQGSSPWPTPLSGAGKETRMSIASRMSIKD
jgi:hypothetical protein